MASIIDERGYNQGFKLTDAQILRLQRRAAAIVAEMDLSANTGQSTQKRILELGCGTGELAYELSILTDVSVTGVDISPKFIAEAQSKFKRPNLTFAEMDLSQHDPEGDAEKFDYIVGNGILHHLYFHLDSFLPALGRWLVPGGRIIFWEPNLLNPYIYLIFSFKRFRKWARLEPDEMAFTPGFIRRKLDKSNFKKIEINTRDFLLPNTPNLLIKPAIGVGKIAEKLPVIRAFAQSVFLRAEI